MKDYWIGLIVAVFVLITAAAVITVNARYEDSLLNDSDNISDNLSELQKQSYRNNACWHVNVTEYSNITYNDSTGCYS